MQIAVLSWFVKHPEVDLKQLQHLLDSDLTYMRDNNLIWESAWILYGLGNIEKTLTGDIDKARQLLTESLNVFDSLEDQWAVTWSLGSLSILMLEAGRLEEAYEYSQRHYELGVELDDFGAKVQSLQYLGNVSYLMGNYDAARYFIYQWLRMLGERRSMTILTFNTLISLGRLFTTEKRYERAVEVFSALHDLPMLQERLRYSERTIVEEWLERLREQLSEEAYSAAEERGHQLEISTLTNALYSELHASGQFRDGKSHHLSDHSSLLEPLTERELEVLQLVTLGMSNREIADELVLALGTVKTHIHNISSKFDASSRGEAVARARALGVI